jgi:hypothetical protein
MWMTKYLGFHGSVSDGTLPLGGRIGYLFLSRFAIAFAYGVLFISYIGREVFNCFLSLPVDALV